MRASKILTATVWVGVRKQRPCSQKEEQEKEEETFAQELQPQRRPGPGEMAATTRESRIQKTKRSKEQARKVYWRPGHFSRPERSF